MMTFFVVLLLNVCWFQTVHSSKLQCPQGLWVLVWGLTLVLTEGHEQTRTVCLSNLHTSILTLVTRDADKRDLFTSQGARLACFWRPFWTKACKSVECPVTANNETLAYCSWCFSVVPFIIVSRLIVESHWKQEIVIKKKRLFCWVRLAPQTSSFALQWENKLLWTQRQLCFLKGVEFNGILEMGGWGCQQETPLLLNKKKNSLSSLPQLLLQGRRNTWVEHKHSFKMTNTSFFKLKLSTA